MSTVAQKPEAYVSKHKIRIVTAASLFDGHDAAINIMRRIIQASGAEVIHLGHDRSVQEIVDCAIQEDANAIAITSYQGGHMEFFKYMYDLLKEKGCGHIRIFGGGGGTILPTEIEELHKYGISRIYSPDDGRAMGLQGMINDMLSKCSPSNLPQGEAHSVVKNLNGSLLKELRNKNFILIGQLISLAESHPDEFEKIYPEILKAVTPSPSGKEGMGLTPVLGI